MIRKVADEDLLPSNFLFTMFQMNLLNYDQFTSFMGMTNDDGTWVRDLTDEGVEPNPGPGKPVPHAANVLKQSKKVWKRKDDKNKGNGDSSSQANGGRKEQSKNNKADKLIASLNDYKTASLVEIDLLKDKIREMNDTSEAKIELANKLIAEKAKVASLFDTAKLDFTYWAKKPMNQAASPSALGRFSEWLTGEPCTERQGVPKYSVKYLHPVNDPNEDIDLRTKNVSNSDAELSAQYCMVKYTVHGGSEAFEYDWRGYPVASVEREEHQVDMMISLELLSQLCSAKNFNPLNSPQDVDKMLASDAARMPFIRSDRTKTLCGQFIHHDTTLCAALMFRCMVQDREELPFLKPAQL
jgi:hypothetical protein